MGTVGDESCRFDQDGNQSEPYMNVENPYRSSVKPTLTNENKVAYVPAYDTYA